MKKTSPSSAESYEAWQRRQDEIKRRCAAIAVALCILGAATVITIVVMACSIGAK